MLSIQAPEIPRSLIRIRRQGSSLRLTTPRPSPRCRRVAADPAPSARLSSGTPSLNRAQRHRRIEGAASPPRLIAGPSLLSTFSSQRGGAAPTPLHQPRRLLSPPPAATLTSPGWLTKSISCSRSSTISPLSMAN